MYKTDTSGATLSEEEQGPRCHLSFPPTISKAMTKASLQGSQKPLISFNSAILLLRKLKPEVTQ